MRSNSYIALDAVVASASAESAAIPVTQCNQCSVIVKTTADAGLTGNVHLEASNDVSTGFPAAVFSPSTWVAITNATVNVTGGGVFIIPTTDICYQFIRAVFTRTGGSTGTVTATVNTSG
jgi:hypothetical protein